MLHFIPNNDLNAYQQKISIDGTYGDHLTLFAMACMHNVQFFVYSSLCDTGRRIISSDKESILQPNVPILYVGHYAEAVGREHYVCVKPAAADSVVNKQPFDESDTSENVNLSTTLENISTGPALHEPVGVKKDIKRPYPYENNNITNRNPNDENDLTKQSTYNIDSDINISNLTSAFHPDESSKFPEFIWRSIALMPH